MPSTPPRTYNVHRIHSLADIPTLTPLQQRSILQRLNGTSPVVTVALPLHRHGLSSLSWDTALGHPSKE